MVRLPTVIFGSVIAGVAPLSTGSPVRVSSRGGGAGGGSFPPKLPNFPPKRKREGKRKGERERERGRGREREREGNGREHIFGYYDICK